MQKQNHNYKKKQAYPQAVNPGLPYQQYLPGRNDEQLSSILYSESQYSNKKPSKRKVYQTPEKKYDHIAQKKMQQQQQQMINQPQNNPIFSFNQHTLLDESGQSATDYKWHLPQRQQLPPQAQVHKRQVNYNQYQYDQQSHGGGDDQHSFIPSDNSSNIFDSMKSFSHSFNHSNNNHQSSPNYSEYQNQMRRQNTNSNSNPSQDILQYSHNYGLTHHSSEEQLDSTDQIIKNMRADLLQVDYKMKQIVPNSNVQVVYEEEQQESSNQTNRNQVDSTYNNNIQNQNGFLYSLSQPLSPSDQQPIEMYDRSKRESFNDISNKQIPTNQKLSSAQQSEQSLRNQENNPQQHPQYHSQQQRTNQSTHQDHSNTIHQKKQQQQQKKKNEDPIVRDIIQNIEASKKYLSQTHQMQNQMKDQKKQMHIYESILDETKGKKIQKQLNNTSYITASNPKNNSKKKKPHYPVAVLDSIQKKRSISLQNSDIKNKSGKKCSQSPKILKNNSSVDFLSHSPKQLIQKSSIESKLSLLKDLTYRHIQSLPLTSHLNSHKKLSQSPNQSQPRSGFEVCTYLKDPSGKSLMRPKSKEQIIQENLQATIKGSGDKKKRLELELSVAKEKKQSEFELSKQLDLNLDKLNEDQKNIGELILMTDSKVNKLEIKNKKLKQKWKEQGLTQQQLNEQESTLQQMRAQEEKNQFIIEELNKCNNEMKSQLENILKQIEAEKLLKNQGVINTKQLQQSLVQEESQMNKVKMLDNLNSLNNTLSLPSSPYTFIGGSLSVKNQLLQNKNINTQFIQMPKSDDSLNNIMGTSFDQQDQMISHLIQKYSPSPKKTQTQTLPSQSNQTINTSSSLQSDYKNKPQNSTQYKSILQARGLHDIMEEPSADESKNSFLPLTHYQK